MANACMIGTRKGLFLLAQNSGSGRWELKPAGFLGDPVTMVLADSRDGTWYAALNLGHFGVKLHRSDSQGEVWEEVASPAFPVKPEDDDDPVPWTVQQIWSLEEGNPGRPGQLWAGTLPGGLFFSDDGGRSWELNRALWDRPERRKWFGGGYEHPGIHSICRHPKTPDRIAVGISCGGIRRTDDGGGNWELVGRGMKAEYMPPDQSDDLNIQDPHRLVQCASKPDAFWVQHHNGIFRSTDSCSSFVPVPNARPSGFGFAVCVHPQDPETAWFVPAVKDERRIPVDGRFVVTRTRDGGSSFHVLTRGLPQGPAYDLVYRHGLDLDASGNSLVLGSTTGSLWISEDQGESFLPITHHLPPVYCVRFLPGP